MLAQQLAVRLKGALESKQPCMIWGPPGVGKTSIAKQVAADNGFDLLYWSLVQKDGVEVGGLPRIVNDRTDFAMPHDFPATGRVLWLLDEFPQAPPLVQNTMSEPILERTLRGVPISPDCVIVATGNKREHASATYDMPMHLRNRFWHCELEPSVDDWCVWAYNHGIEELIIAFIRHLGATHLSTFDKGQNAFATPRTWEFLSRELKFILANPELQTEMINGHVGEGAGIAFAGFLRLATEVPDPDECLRNPLTAPVPTKPGLLYMLTVALANRCKPATADAFFAYIDRIPDEFAVTAYKDAQMRDKTLLIKSAGGRKFVQKHASAFL